MTIAQLVDKFDRKGFKFMLVRNFKSVPATQRAIKKHHLAIKEGIDRKLIVMAIQNDIIPDYTILVLTTYPLREELYKYGFYPVKIDRANKIPLKFRNHVYLTKREVMQYVQLEELYRN